MTDAPGHSRGRRARRRAHRRRGGAHALPAQRDAVAHRQGRCLGEVREPAVHRLVQGARRAEHAAAAHATRRRSAASSPCRPATTPRAWPITPAGSAFRPPSSCRPSRPTPRWSTRAATARASSCTATRWPRRRTEAHRLADAEQLAFVHPYDDPRIIAGQGTIALEMLQDAPELDTLVAPVGGGGMIAGCAVAARGLKPDIKVIGVETDELLGDAPAAGRRAGDGGRRHHRRGHRRARHRQDAARHRPGAARPGADRRRGGDRARHRALPRGREDGGRGRGRRRPRRAAGPSAAFHRPQGRPGAVAAATSTPACWPRCCCAAWCATAASCGCG